jgi:hypothetical protein
MKFRLPCYESGAEEDSCSYAMVIRPFCNSEYQFLPRYLGNVTFTYLVLLATLYGLRHVKDKGVVFTAVTAYEE